MPLLLERIPLEVLLRRRTTLFTPPVMRTLLEQWNAERAAMGENWLLPAIAILCVVVLFFY